MEAQEIEKKNYCTEKGECTIPQGTSETACEHGKISTTTGLCIFRAWFEDKCLSPFALMAARVAALPVLRPGMDF